MPPKCEGFIRYGSGVAQATRLDRERQLYGLRREPRHAAMTGYTPGGRAGALWHDR